MLKFIGGILITSLLLSCNKQEEPPNILFIFADDQCYNTIRELGNEEVYTPTLDELARQGTVFTRAYNMGGWHGAVCVASRTMINTGKFLWRANALETQLDTLAARGQLWSKEMERLGYDTYMTGKWHVNIQPPEIFNHVGTVRGGMPGAVPEMYDRPLNENDWEWTPWDTAFGGFWKGGTHWSEVVANETMGFLDRSAGSAKPFFMYIAFNAPHDPRQSPKEYVDMYPLEHVAVPDNFLPEYPYKDEIGCSATLRDEMLAPFPRTEYSVRVHRQEYYAIISHLDAQIARILAHLEETGQAENTYIFFTADHGLSVGHHGLMGKQNMYDHSMRPPLMVVGPGIPKGKRKKMAVYLQDIMPTAIEYAGGEVPEWVEFNSLRPKIEGLGVDSSYPEIYGAYMDLQRMIRVDDYKLIVYPKAGVIKLFDLINDPSEQHNLAAATAQQERIRNLFGKLQELQEEMGDTLKLAKYNFGL
ncbi:MAG: sulfatase-like hydrolase/transferase [Bacteroidales bacterium]|nr:sulfatase-like hydrolase/transferase [Bacteroidales bacterium]